MSSIPTGQYVNLGHVVVRWKNQDRNVARWRNEERKCPYLDSSVISGRCNPLAIRTESEAVDRQTMSFVGEDASLPADIPQLSIKKFKKLVNSCGIFSDNNFQGLGDNFLEKFRTYFDVGVCGSGGKEISVRMKVKCPDAGSMASERADHASSFQVPDFDGTGCTSSADQLFRR